MDTAENVPVTISEIGERIRFANACLSLEFCRKTGRFLSLTNGVGDSVLTNGEWVSPVLLNVGGRTTVTTGREHLWSVVDATAVGGGLTLMQWSDETDAEGCRWLTLETAEGDWIVRQQYGLAADDDIVQRRVQLTWNGQQETLLRSVELRTPAWATLDNAMLEAPGYPGVLHQPLRRLPMGGWKFTPDIPDADAPVWRPGVLAITTGETNFLAWGFHDEIPSIMQVHRGDAGVWITQKLIACCRMAPGQTLEVGTQYLRVHRGTLHDALSVMSAFWQHVRVGGTTVQPDWVSDARIYEAHIGVKTFRDNRTHAPYPEMDALIADLPRIVDLGFNIVELMPHMPYPGYSVHDYFDVSTHYAPEAKLREFIARAHELGLKVLFDVIMHGVVDQTVNPRSPIERHPYFEAHPDWFSRTEDGRIARTYTKAFDHANSAFQDFIVDVFTFYVREFDVDGFRVDALTWNFFPNWAEGLAYPGYRSFYGSAPMFKKVRAALHAIKPEIMLYTETAGPLFSRSYDLSYNYDEQWVYCTFPLKTTREFACNGYAISRPFTAHDVAEWLHLRRLVLPQGWRKVHHLDSHDTHEWGGQAMFRREAFGVEAARMLFAWCAFLDGGIMNYAGAEEESQEHYRTVLRLRESIPAVREGACDYLAVRATDDRLFTPLREKGGQWAIPVLSFATEAVQATLPLAALALAPSARYRLREEFSGETRQLSGGELSELTLSLPPYGVQLWTLTPET